MNLEQKKLALRIQTAIDKFDISLPGAFEAFAAVQTDDVTEESAKAVEALAVEFPQCLRSMPAVTSAAFDHAIGQLMAYAKTDSLALQIRSGADIGYENPPRIPTGSLVLDRITNGGYPRGFLSQIKGKENGGKSTSLYITAGKTIRSGGTVLWVAGERPDLSWARRCNCSIFYAPDELVKMEGDELELAELYNATHPEAGNFVLLVGKYGNKVLEAIVRAIETNAFDLIVIDSITVFKKQTTLVKKETGDETRGGEAKLFNDFCARMESAFNYIESRRGKMLDKKWKCEYCEGIFDVKKDHKSCTKSKSKGKTKPSKLVAHGEYMGAVRTAIVAVNQIRDQGLDGYGGKKPDAGGGRGLKHAKALDLDFSYTTPCTTSIGALSVTYAQRTSVYVTKSKVGPPSRSGIVEIQVEDIPSLGIKAGRFNLVPELMGSRMKEDDVQEMGLAEQSGAITKKAAWYYFGDESFNGATAFLKYLRSNPITVKAIVAHIEAWIAKDGPIQGA